MSERNIYNAETKQRFLDSINLEQYPVSWWDRVFDKSKIFEELYQRDLYDFSTANILEFFKYLDIANINTLVVYKANLARYAEWAVSQNLVADNQIHFNELTTEILSTCISKARMDNSIISYDKLRSIHFVNYQDAFVFWSLFEGIKGKDYEEIVNLKMEDIDTVNKTATLCTGRTINVSDIFISVAKNASEETKYITLKDADLVLPLIPDIYIFKQKRMSRGMDKPRTVYSTIVRNIRYFLELFKDVTARSIKDSGLIYYLNKRAEEYNMTVEDLFYDLSKCKDIVDKYNFNLLVRRKWIVMYKDYLR